MLTPTAEKIFLSKYARTLPNGNKEDWEQCVSRVALYVASAEKDDDFAPAMAAFTRVMYELSFLPGGRTLANAGTGIKNLMNCFVVPIEDSRESIYDALKKAAEIFAWGGGLGYNFSHLRGEGQLVKTTGGDASGPLSFMSLFDQTGEVISQASRRGAQMGILNIDHPDIAKFINYKNTLNTRNQRLYDEYLRNLKSSGLDHDGLKYFQVMRKTLADDQLTHFNISVAVPDDFMKRIIDGNAVAENLLYQVAQNAWKSGDPGIFFIDRANDDNMTPFLGNIEATNPCGEIGLLPYEACCLGSLNLMAFNEKDYFDWNYLKEVIRVAVRFLDNVQTLNETPVPEIDEATRKTRRLGLGVMGLADVLADRGLPYDSQGARDFCKDLAKFIHLECWKASEDLAAERGPFPAFDENKVNWSVMTKNPDLKDLDRRPVRNVAVTAIAPTGSIALLAGVNSGIEPFFARRYIRNITEGIGNSAKASVTQGVESGVKTAHDIHWKDHINMQAIWQMYVDNAVSKTVNMKNDVSAAEILDAYVYAWERGLKGITVYRDNSRLFQVLNKE